MTYLYQECYFVICILNIMVKFYVYTHAKPNGEIFYVGKGSGNRCNEFGKGLRNQYHVNIVNKYGKENIIITKIDCESEIFALQLEKCLISGLKRIGNTLANLTNGGEGLSGSTYIQKLTKPHGNIGKKRSLETKNKMRETTLGRIKITNGVIFKYIKENELLPFGWKFVISVPTNGIITVWGNKTQKK